MKVWNPDVKKDNDHHDSILANGYTGCDVIVFSQHEVLGYYPRTDDEVCISIGSQKWGVCAPQLSSSYKEVLALEFDDMALGDKDDAFGKNLSDEDALKTVKFFAKHLTKSKKIVIHCFAGLSRSRSMAAALCLCFKLPFQYTILNESVKFQIFKAYKQMRKDELECLSESAVISTDQQLG